MEVELQEPRALNCLKKITQLRTTTSKNEIVRPVGPKNVNATNINLKVDEDNSSLKV